METLAEYLARTNPPPLEQTTEPSRLEDITDAKAFADAVLGSREFRSYILNGLALGNLPAAVLCRLMDHGWGKPTMRLEVDDRSLENLTPERVREKLERTQRLLQLLEAAQSNTFHTEPESVH